jgi:GR25 family glycosyltransferase involved in LPS biosynthesis
MSRRRAPPVDLMSKSTPTKLRQDNKRHPLKIHSPTHSIPGKKPKTFDLTVLGSFGDLGHQIALAFVQYNSASPYSSASGRAVSLRSFLRSVVIASKAKQMDLASLEANKWRKLASGWFVQLKAQKGLSDITKNFHLTNCTLFFQYLSEKGIVPAYPWPSSVPNAKNEHRPSIAQTKLGSASLAEVNSWPRQDRSDWAELQALAADPSPQARKKRGDIMKSIVCRHAEREIRTAWHLYLETQKIIESNVTFDFDAYCQQFETVSENRIVRKRGWQRALSSLPNVLVYIVLISTEK